MRVCRGTGTLESTRVYLRQHSYRTGHFLAVSLEMPIPWEHSPVDVVRWAANGLGTLYSSDIGRRQSTTVDKGRFP